MTGFVITPGDVFDFARAIETLRIFDEVRVKDSKSAPLGAMPATRFELEAIVTDLREYAQ